MTEREAWELVRDRVRWPSIGLCILITDPRIPWSVQDDMKTKVMEYRGYYNRRYPEAAYRWPLTPRGQRARVLFCERMIRQCT